MTFECYKAFSMQYFIHEWLLCFQVSCHYSQILWLGEESKQIFILPKNSLKSSQCRRIPCIQYGCKLWHQKRIIGIFFSMIGFNFMNQKNFYLWRFYLFLISRFLHVWESWNILRQSSKLRHLILTMNNTMSVITF